jgi:hypothetical protein
MYVYLSGLPRELIFARTPIKDFIMKPMSKYELGKVVRNVLDRT